MKVHCVTNEIKLRIESVFVSFILNVFFVFIHYVDDVNQS